MSGVQELSAYEWAVLTLSAYEWAVITEQSYREALRYEDPCGAEWYRQNAELTGYVL